MRRASEALRDSEKIVAALKGILGAAAVIGRWRVASRDGVGRRPKGQWKMAVRQSWRRGRHGGAFLVFYV